MTPEFFYGETLRWSFGFENPNKAAVVFACLAPLFWGAWMAAWGLAGQRWKALVLLGSGVGFLACWACLLLTFSRGGAVGATAGMVVASLWGWRQLRSQSAGLASVVLIGVVLVAALVLGAAERGMEAMGDDASVANRWELWTVALQMAYENPGGFGAGNSGREYMQWYQDLERTEGYRTMVNSYLTFLVEWGWGLFALGLFAILAVWCWTWPAGAGEPHARLRATVWGSLTAFLVSGIFSTTMEEPWLWGIPVLGLVGLALIRSRIREASRGRWLACFAVGASFLLVLYCGGMWRCWSDPMGRTFRGATPSSSNVAAVFLKSNNADRQEIGLAVDEDVLGPDWGKLVRTLAEQTGRRILIMDPSGPAPDRIVLAGDAVNQYERLTPGVRLLLLAPSRTDNDVRGLILLPEIDEDGRGRFWREKEGVRIVELVGVGNRVEWAWDQVIAHVKEW